MKATRTITTLAALAATFISSSAIAETRIWTDASGKTIEAEQVKLLNDQVVLRLVNGNEIRVSLAKLSAEDREMAMLSQPPVLELKVAAKTERSNSSMFQVGRGSRIQIEKESTVVTVDILKTSSAAYEAPLRAVLYMMGERGGEYGVVLHKSFEMFTYDGRMNEFELVSDAYTSETREGGVRGEEYKGWLVAVFDINGEIVAMKGSAREYSENADALLAVEQGTVLSAEYETLKSESEHAMAKRRAF